MPIRRTARVRALLLALATTVAVPGVALADPAPSRHYPKGFPYLPTRLDDVEPATAEGCAVVTLVYPGRSRDGLAREFRARLATAGWRVRRQRHAAPGTLDWHARRAGRMVPVVLGAVAAGATLSVYSCETDAGPTSG
jgi:hypothetical protein